MMSKIGCGVAAVAFAAASALSLALVGPAAAGPLGQIRSVAGADVPSASALTPLAPGFPAPLATPWAWVGRFFLGLLVDEALDRVISKEDARDSRRSSPPDRPAAGGYGGSPPERVREPSPVIPQPSFDCANASRATEHVVCNSVYLSDLDRRMAGLYWEARSDPGVDSAELIASQKDWLRRIWRECGSGNDDAVTCLEDEYEARIAVLDSLG